MSKHKKVRLLRVNHYDGSTITVEHENGKRTKSGFIRAFNRIRNNSHKEQRTPIREGVVKMHGYYYLVKRYKKSKVGI